MKTKQHHLNSIRIKGTQALANRWTLEWDLRTLAILMVDVSWPQTHKSSLSSIVQIGSD